ncbi:MAG: DUF484 family protein [Gallionella sp.]
MKSEDVAHYLLNTPEFFEEHVDTLAQITLSHPHGGRTISLSERQLFALREKNKGLERKLDEMLEYAKENDALQNKVHEFSLALFSARDVFTVRELVTHLLADLFSVPHVAMHLWQISPPSMEVLIFTDMQAKPVCLHQPAHETASWFGDNAAQLHSFAYLPLRSDGVSNGLLVLASEDKERFYPEMGTVFLQRIADVVSSALNPYLEH